MKSFEQRTFFLPAFTSRACLIASMGEIFIARRDGIHAETKTVSTATATATATACHETEKLMPNGATDFTEGGPGAVLQGLIKKIDGTVSAHGIV